MTKLFINSSLALLGLAGVAKLIASMGEMSALRDVDPLFQFLTNRQVIFIVGLLEIGAASSMFWKRGPVVHLLLIFWLSLMFLSYRLGMWIVGAKKPCGCLGDLGHWLGLSPATAELLSRWFLGIMLVGSVTFLWGNYRQPQAPLRHCLSR